MSVFFTADLHLGHQNIIKYCNRPFRDADHMNTALIRNWNSRVKHGDTVFHLGDFCCYGAERGVPGTKIKSDSWIEQLCGNIIHIRGNHDANNTVKCALEYATVQFSNTLWFMSHRPPWQLPVPPPEADVYLCGHDHEKWRTENWNGHLVINVGVDANKFIPLNKAEITAIKTRYEKEQLCSSLDS